MGTDSKSASGKKKRFKWPIRIAVVLLVYTITGFFIVPAIIKSQMLKRLPALTKRQVEVAQVKCNPYALSLTIRGFALKEPNGEVFSSFDEFYANFQLWASLFKRSWVFEEISLKKPFAQVTYRADGTFNFANLLEAAASTPKSPPSSKPTELPSALIYNLYVTNGAVAFDDLKRKQTFHTEFIPIDVHLTNLTTVRDGNAPYSFVARTGEGESFAWRGHVTINPLRSDGTFRLGGLKLEKYSTYAHDYARFDIADGMVDVASDYRYDSATNALDLSVSNTVVHLNHLELKAPDTGETVLAIPAFDITDIEASVAKFKARVGLVKSTGGSIVVRQEKDGAINLLSMLILPPAPASDAKKAATTPSPFPTPVVKIDEIQFDDYTIKAEDKKPEKPASFNIDQLGFDVKGVSNVSNAPVTAAVWLRFQGTGNIGVNGKLTLMPPTADVELGVTNIDLRSIQPYVEEQIKLSITSGAVGLNGNARYASPEPGAPLISFTGDFSLTNFATADEVLFKDFLKWDALNVTGIAVQLQPDKFHVDEVKFTGLNTSLIVGPDKRANVQTILQNQIAAKTNAPAAEQAAAPVAKAPLPDISLGALVFENASIHFGDQSIEPHCAFDVAEFSGSIKGLSSQTNSTATVDVKGKVDERSPFSVSGKINPLTPNVMDTYADIAVAFTNTELTAFTPYTEKFAGRPLQKGKLSFSVHYLLDKRALKAENGFYVDQMTLGPKNNSPDATKLPVKLAIALLKDRHGRINLDVPLGGKIDDPSFRVGPIIWQVVVNLIVKAATSPFSLLGAAFGGGDELSFVQFAPGQATIPDTETNKLETLAKALYERPEVSLEINGAVDPTADRPPMTEMKFEQQIKTLYLKELSDAGKPAMAMADVQLTPDDYNRLIVKAYKTTFGEYKPAAVSTNAPAATNAIPVVVRAVAVDVPPSQEGHGAGLLLRSTPEIKMVSIPVTSASVTNAPAVPMTEKEAEIADMKEQLLQKITVTDDDLRELMKQRAATVQSYLLKSQKVTGERLFITAPKALDGAFKPEDRVNMTLD